MWIIMRCLEHPTAYTRTHIIWREYLAVLYRKIYFHYNRIWWSCICARIERFFWYTSFLALWCVGARMVSRHRETKIFGLADACMCRLRVCVCAHKRTTRRGNVLCNIFMNPTERPTKYLRNFRWEMCGLLNFWSTEQRLSNSYFAYSVFFAFVYCAKNGDFIRILLYKAQCMPFSIAQFLAFDIDV